MPEVRKKCQRCGLNRQMKFYVSARARICFTCQRKKRKTTSRVGRVRRTYGLSPKDYAALMEANGGRCMICAGKRARLDVDHDHSREHLGQREAVRGLICARCNRWAIPGVAGDPYIARALAVYLLNPPAFRILGTGKVR